MKQLITLVRREIWEFKSTFLNLPFVMGALLLLIALCGTIFFIQTGHYPHVLNVNLQPNSYNNLVQTFVYATSMPFVVVLWLMVCNYFLSCLFDDRKNRSILFWQSMPVSQCKTIISKCITGFLVAPILSMVAVIATEMVLLVFLSIFVAHFSLGNFWLLWHPQTLFMSWLRMCMTFFLQALWLFPIFCWLMFCSAYAHKTPFKMAVIFPVIIIIIEWFFDANHYFSSFIFDRIGYSFVEYFSLPSFHFPADYFYAMGFGIIIGLVFLIAAGFMRSRCYHFENM